MIKISELEKKLDHNFKNKNLLELALTHSSFSHENNERLEFLGDAVLELIITEFLFKSFVDFREGELTKLRSKIVCEYNLANLAKKLDLGKFLKLSNGEDKSNGREKNSILSDTVEAIIGAMFLDCGLKKTKKIVLSLIDKKNGLNNIKFEDSKSKLQEIIQKFSKEPIVYKIIKETGPDHEKNYVVRAIHKNAVLGEGSGKSKKEAEQLAAFDYLDNLSKK
ncbi:MAG: ribonuclease III [Clostridiales bacterium]|jgi:ribonuclease-3|nr:ribonuclease III [Clostridiales bacterium]